MFDERLIDIAIEKIADCPDADPETLMAIFFWRAICFAMALSAEDRFAFFAEDVSRGDLFADPAILAIALYGAGLMADVQTLAAA
jgi:hypothetical protein